MKKSLPLALLLLVLILGNGCAHRPLGPAGVELQPGQYLEAFSRAPDYAPEQVPCALEPFLIEQASGIAPETFQALLQQELTRAWAANGLKQAPPGDQNCLLTGTVEAVKIRGRRFRFLIGKISADLWVSGTIRRGDEVLFAFRDRVHVVSPVNPGPPPPKETELLLQQAVRIFATHLLNELLIHGFADGG